MSRLDGGKPVPQDLALQDAAFRTSEQFLAVAADAFERGALPLAIKAARLAVEHHPSRKTLGPLAAYLAANGDAHEVIRTYERLLGLQREPMDAPVAVAMGLAEAELGNFDQALNHLWRVVALHRDNDELWFHIGSCYAMQRQFAAANHVFSRNLALPLLDGRATSTALLRLPYSRERIPTVADSALPFERNFSLARDTVAADARASAADVVHLVCCDSSYFRLFARPLVRSIAENAGLSAAVHFHICNPEPDDLALLGRLRQEAESVPIACSIERVSFGSMTAEQIKTYLTCARFLLLPELQAHYDKVILVTDADQTIVRPIDRLIEQARAHDVGLLLFQRATYNILALISASVCIAGPSAKSRSFFEAVRAYIRERMTDPQALGWHLDQAALAAVYLASSDLDFYLIPPTSMVSKVLKPSSENRSDEPLFWSVTYSIKANARKLDMDEFRGMAS